eukprot:maker-scaffold_7-snap-gene-15.38-mRNA-1 protein AED:0.64 eAED:0.64 QI:0/0/0/0.5/0/0/2/0/178
MITHCENCNPGLLDDNTLIRNQIDLPVFFFSERTVELIYISSKELYPIWFSFKRIPWLFFGQESTITIFTDHKNLQYVLTSEASPNQLQVGRMSRWSYQFQQLDIVVRHIPGEENVATDILSRWGNRYVEKVVKIDDSQTDLVMFVNNISILNVEVGLKTSTRPRRSMMRTEFHSYRL